MYHFHSLLSHLGLFCILKQYHHVKILERTHKSFLLTEVGLKLVERARHILDHADEMKEIARSAKDPYSGELKLGILPTLAPYYFCQ